MSESFLHYLWQFQYFDKRELFSSEGEHIDILKQGIINGDAGPDFLQAKIKIEGIEWAGSVEIHIKASDWLEHNHDHDAAYENVILHVVWEENIAIARKDGSRIPTLVLKPRVDPKLLISYQKLINYPSVIPCEKSFPHVDDLIKISMIDKALMKRLEDKANRINALLNLNKGDWEQTTYQLLAESFGFKVNKDPFIELAKSLPYRLIQKNRTQLLSVEALIFGQAGFLIGGSKDTYLDSLNKEYDFLDKKYSLKATQMNVVRWKFLRLRPANFPTLRLSQFSALLQSKQNIFSQLIELNEYGKLRKYFETETSLYWKNHYRFGKKAVGSVPEFGSASTDIIIINTVVPLLVAYGKSIDDWSLVDRAVNVLQQITSEKNRITDVWKKVGYISKSAFDSQGLIELYQNFCERRQCLNCAIGSYLLKPETMRKS